MVKILPTNLCKQYCPISDACLYEDNDLNVEECDLWKEIADEYDVYKRLNIK